MSWLDNVLTRQCVVNLVCVCCDQVCAAGFFASLEFPVDQIDSPEFYPDSPWALRCLFMCFRIMLFRFRFVRPLQIFYLFLL